MDLLVDATETARAVIGPLTNSFPESLLQIRFEKLWKFIYNTAYMVCSQHIDRAANCFAHPTSRRRAAEGSLYLQSRRSILWLKGPGGTLTSSFKFRIAKQAFTFAIITLFTPHFPHRGPPQYRDGSVRIRVSLHP